MLYCSHCLQQSSAFSLGREGERNEPFYSSDIIRMGQGFLQNTGHFVLTCLRFKDVFKKKIIPFEAVNKKE